MSVTVTTQAELDAALAANEPTIYIGSPAGVWLRVEQSGSSRVVAWGSSRVVAWGSSHVVAWGSSHVEAWDSSHVVAWDSSHVEARDSSHVVARDSSRVEARDSSHVVASKYVAVHLHSARVTLVGGVLIDLTAINDKDVYDWCEYTGAKRVGGTLTLYKAVDDTFQAGHGYTLTKYTPGTTVTEKDWRADNECGHGLHLCVTPRHARGFFTSATRFVECQVQVADVSTIGFDKLKAREVMCVREVDIDGEPVAT